MVSRPAASSPQSLRILSFNVLFPNAVNSETGKQRSWWIYKYYTATEPPQFFSGDETSAAGAPEGSHPSAWPLRKALLHRIIAEVDADVVCLQEPRPPNFGESTQALEDGLTEDFYRDFAFMFAELGYEGEILGKGMIRPATFWKKQKICKIGESGHKYERGAGGLNLRAEFFIRSGKISNTKPGAPPLKNA